MYVPRKEVRIRKYVIVIGIHPVYSTVDKKYKDRREKTVSTRGEKSIRERRL